MKIGMFDIETGPLRVHEGRGEPELKEGEQVIAVMSAKGDTKLIFDPAIADEVDAARETFERLTEKGYTAYRVNPEDASKGTQMRKFDAKAGKVILVPQMAGG